MMLSELTVYDKDFLSSRNVLTGCLDKILTWLDIWKIMVTICAHVAYVAEKTLQ